MPEAKEIDRGEYERLIKNYHRGLVGYFTGFGIDKESAEELAEETWVQVWRVFIERPERAFNPAIGSFYTYVTSGFAKYNALKYWRRPVEPTGVEEGSQIEDVKERVADKLADIERRLMAFRESFRLLFLCGGYPHEQLAFAWSKHIYADDKHSGGRGAPIRLKTEKGRTPLDQSADEYWQAYQSTASLPNAEAAAMLPSLDPMLKRLSLPISELFKTGEKIMEVLRDTPNGRVAGTRLEQYFRLYGEGEFSAAVSNWCDNIKKKIEACLNLEPGSGKARVIDAAVASAARDSTIPIGCTRWRCKLFACCPAIENGGQS